MLFNVKSGLERGIKHAIGCAGYNPCCEFYPPEAHTGGYPSPAFAAGYNAWPTTGQVPAYLLSSITSREITQRSQGHTQTAA